MIAVQSVVSVRALRPSEVRVKNYRDFGGNFNMAVTFPLVKALGHSKVRLKKS
jgi:hypothetical protein